jgi:hypothetical protein
MHIFGSIYCEGIPLSDLENGLRGQMKHGGGALQNANIYGYICSLLD